MDTSKFTAAINTLGVAVKSLQSAIISQEAEDAIKAEIVSVRSGIKGVEDVLAEHPEEDGVDIEPAVELVEQAKQLIAEALRLIAQGHIDEATKALQDAKDRYEELLNADPPASDEDLENALDDLNDKRQELKDTLYDYAETEGVDTSEADQALQDAIDIVPTPELVHMTEEQIQSMVIEIFNNVNQRIDDHIIQSITAGDFNHTPSANAVKKYTDKEIAKLRETVMNLNHWDVVTVTGTTNLTEALQAVGHTINEDGLQRIALLNGIEDWEGSEGQKEYLWKRLKAGNLIRKSDDSGVTYYPRYYGGLPQSAPNNRTIYMQRDSVEDRTWELWVYIDGEWVNVGDTSIDLEHYWAKDNIDGLTDALFNSEYYIQHLTDVINRCQQQFMEETLDNRYVSIEKFEDLLGGSADEEVGGDDEYDEDEEFDPETAVNGGVRPKNKLESLILDTAVKLVKGIFNIHGDLTYNAIEEAVVTMVKNRQNDVMPVVKNSTVKAMVAEVLSTDTNLINLTFTTDATKPDGSKLFEDQNYEGVHARASGNYTDYFDGDTDEIQYTSGDRKFAFNEWESNVKGNNVEYKTQFTDVTTFNLNIHYLDVNGDSIEPMSTEEKLHDTEYSVTPPEIPGYFYVKTKADSSDLTGTMDTNKDVKLEYAPIPKETDIKTTFTLDKPIDASTVPGTTVDITARLSNTTNVKHVVQVKSLTEECTITGCTEEQDTDIPSRLYLGINLHYTIPEDHEGDHVVQLQVLDKGCIDNEDYTCTHIDQDVVLEMVTVKFNPNKEEDPACPLTEKTIENTFKRTTDDYSDLYGEIEQMTWEHDESNTYTFQGWERVDSDDPNTIVFKPKVNITKKLF